VYGGNSLAIELRFNDKKSNIEKAFIMEIDELFENVCVNLLLLLKTLSIAQILN
jgi:hypothetical protein